MKKPLQLAAFLCGCLLATTAFAAPGKEPGFKFGNGWTLLPQVSLGLFWESNARDTVNDEESGGGWRVQPSFSLNYELNRTRLGINGFYTLERGFDDEDAQDTDSYGVSFALLRELGSRWNLSLSASYVHSEDDEFYGEGWDLNNPMAFRVETDESDNYTVNGALGYTSAKWQASIGFGWSRQDYDDDWNNTSDSYNVSLMGGRAIGQNTFWNLSVTGQWDDPTHGDTSLAYYIMTGVNGDLSRKLSYSVMVGLGIYDFDGADGYSSDTEYGPSYSASLSYKINKTFALSLSLNSRYEAEYAGYADCYYVWSHNLSAGLNAQWTDKFSSSLRLAAFYEDHISSDARGGSDNDRTYYQVVLGSSYRFNRYMSLNGSISWKNDQYDYGQSGDDSSDDFRADIGLTFTF